MKSFVLACIAVFAISVAASSILASRQLNVEEQFTRSSVRLDEGKAKH
ncbi:MAG: hypothetical protein ACRCXM_06765 [Beijerinckiaceae bacterium]